MVVGHQSEYASKDEAIRSITQKISCSGETRRNWVRQTERDQGQRAGPASREKERIKVLERENRELRQAKETQRMASALSCRLLCRRTTPMLRDGLTLGSCRAVPSATRS